MIQLEQDKFGERLDFAINLLKGKSKENNLDFNEALLIEASNIARCLFVRSEIQYSGSR